MHLNNEYKHAHSEHEVQALKQLLTPAEWSKEFDLAIDEVLTAQSNDQLLGMGNLKKQELQWPFSIYLCVLFDIEKGHIQEILSHVIT